MSVWFKYLKKRLQPFKSRCLCNASTVSIDDENKCHKSSSSSRKTNRKRSIRVNRQKSINKTKEQRQQHSVQNKSARVVSVSTILFNTPKQTPEKTGSELFTSNIDYNRAAASSCNYAYDNPCFIFDSLSHTNLTPTSTTSSSQSMVTYRSRYGDGLQEASLHQSFLSLGNNPAQLSDNQDNQEQQSTPYNPTGGFKKSHTVNNLDWTGQNRPDMPRSNTTYTVLQGQQNSRIIDYFNNLEVKKPPVKRKANVKRVSDVAKQMRTEDDEVTYDEIDKLQEVFFNDSTLSAGSCCTDEVKKSDKNRDGVAASNDDLVTCYESPIGSDVSLNDATSTSVARVRYVKKGHNGSTSSSPKSYVSSRSFACVSDDEREPLTMARQSDGGKLNETRLIDNSMEKTRRTSSLSKLSIKALHSPLNASRSSVIKSALSESSLNAKSDTVVLGGTETTYNVTETLTNHETKLDEDAMTSSEFKRGTEPRLSKNIKKMFQNIINQQMNALNSLEKFYESQANKLEADRQHSLSLNPTNHVKINEHYDSQLKLLEERVHTNLQTLLANKSTVPVKVGSQNRLNREENLTNNLALNQKLSQLFLLKQIKLQNHSTVRQPMAQVKSSLMGPILPSKPCSKSQRRSLNEDNPGPQFVLVNDQELEEQAPMFKRNLSLPFKQTRQVKLPPSANKPIRSPRVTANLVKFNKQQLQATSSPMYNKSSQFQKNVLPVQKKASIEKIIPDNDEELTYVKPIENTNMLANSAFAHIKRQNKSISSIHPESSCTFYKFSPGSETNNLNEIFYSTNTSINSLNAVPTPTLHFGEVHQSKPYKYISPRLSDGHLQYRFRMAAAHKVDNSDVKSMIETQV